MAIDVERLMLKAGHMLPPGAVLKPAERKAIEDLIRVVRAEALEEAAKVCDEKYNTHAANGFPREASTARALAAAIRALAKGGE